MTHRDTRKRGRAERVAAGASFADGKLIDAARLVGFLEAVLRPGDRVCLEGENQKQADLLRRPLLLCRVAEVLKWRRRTPK